MTLYRSTGYIMTSMRSKASPFLIATLLLGSIGPSSAEWIRCSSKGQEQTEQIEPTPKTESVTLLVRGMMKSRSGAT